MEKEIKNKGQISIFQALTIGGSILVALIGGWFSQAGRTDAKLELAKEEQKANNLALVQRVTVVETDTISIKEDLKEIKSDVKSLLKLLK